MIRPKVIWSIRQYDERGTFLVIGFVNAGFTIPSASLSPAGLLSESSSVALYCLVYFQLIFTQTSCSGMIVEVKQNKTKKPMQLECQTMEN